MPDSTASSPKIIVEGGASNNTIYAGNGNETIYGGSYGTNTLYGYSKYDDKAVSRLVGGPSDDALKQQGDPDLPLISNSSNSNVTIHSGLSDAIMVGGPGTNRFISDIPRYATDDVPKVSTQVIWGGGGTSTYEIHGGQVFTYTMANPTAEKIAHLDLRMFQGVTGTDHRDGITAAKVLETLQSTDYPTLGSDGITIIIDPGPNDTLLVDGTAADGSSFSQSYNLASAIQQRDAGTLKPQTVSYKTDASFWLDDKDTQEQPLTINAGDGSGGSLAPSAPNASLFGGGGDVTYALGAGDGAVTIDNYADGNTGSTGTVSFNSTVASADVTVSADAAGDALLTNAATGKTVTVLSALSDPNYAIREVSFTDGTNLTQAQLATLAATGSPTNTSIYGFSGHDTLDSKGYAYLAQGKGGSDSFIFNPGYGHLTVNEATAAVSPAAANTLVFGPGVTPASLQAIFVGPFGPWSRFNGTDLILTDGVAGDQVTLANMLTSAGAGVQQAVFADGTVWTRQQLLALASAGTVGADTLYGTQDADTLDGQGAPAGSQDYEQGNGGADTFVFKPGYGHLKINEGASYSNTGTTVLRLGVGITADQLAATLDSLGNLTLTDGVAGDQVRLDGLPNPGGPGHPAFAVQQVALADGTTLAVQQLVDAATTGTGNEDALYGTAGGDTLDGKGAPAGSQDYEQGNGGADTFVFKPGYGHLEINEGAGYGAVSAAVLQLGAGITAGQLAATLDSSGNLFLSDGVDGDQVRIDGPPGYSSPASYAQYGVSQVRLADGTVLTRQQLVALATVGTAGADTLYGTGGAEALDGKGAPAGSQDYEQGNGGADTFVFNPGYGQLEISENAGYGAASTAVLQLGAGITMGGIAAAADGAGNVVLTDGVDGDQVRIDGLLDSSYDGHAQYGVARIQFADGSTLSRQQIVNMVTTGTTGADTLAGTKGADTFDGKGAPAGSQDYEQGNGGADTFVFKPGYGHLEINEDAGYYNATTAVLQLGAGITPDQLSATVDGSANLLLGDAATGDQVKIDGMLRPLAYGRAQYGITEVRFADGTTWTRQQVAALGMRSTTGADFLYGTEAVDTFDGQGATAGSQDYEQGNGGADIFVFNPGYGHLEINEDAGDYINSTATLQLGAGITAANLGVSRDASGNVFLTDGTAGDQVELDAMLTSDWSGYTRHGVAQVQLADGAVLTRQQIMDLTMTGTAGADTLYGTASADTLDGKGAPAGSQDYLQGGGGADTFVFNPGYGQLEINEDAGYYTASTATLQLGAGITAANLAASRDADGNLFLTDGVAGDRVEVDGMLNLGYGDYAQHGVAQVAFADGTILSRQQVAALTMMGTAGADTLYGTADADTLDGKGAPTGSQDTVQGNGGADAFVFNAGYGHLEISEDAGYYTDSTARLQLGAAVTAASLSVSTDGYGNVFLTGGVAGDQIKLDGMLSPTYGNYAQYGVAQVQFADGTAWTRGQVEALAGMGTAGSDAISGTYGNDLLDGRGGGDTINGGGGYDTYFVRQGYGTLTIDNSAPGGTAAQGEVDFGPGITEQNLWFSRSGDDLVASILGSADAVDVKGWFGTDPSAQLAGFKAFDGLRLDGQVGQLTAAMASYASSTPGFDPATAAAMPADPTLRSALATAWHS